MLTQINHYLSLVRFSHTLFALPFAVAAMFWAADGWPGARVFILVLLCMVFCRNAAMAFNRLVDASFDARNPRTAGRHLPAGVLSRTGVTAFLAANSALFVIATWFLNPLAFALSIPALLAVCFYSVTKRFTSWSHLFLGLAIGISPVGAWIAVQGTFGAEAALLCLTLLFWIAGFDIIYATQDEGFDRKAGLNSVAVRFGVAGALRVSLALHAAMLACLILIEVVFGLGWPFRAALAAVAALLVYLHVFRRGNSLDGMNQDFFQANIAVSLAVFLGITAAVFF
jgi:4-hydroxybenzoate polyprenyltransferase